MQDIEFYLYTLLATFYGITFLVMADNVRRTRIAVERIAEKLAKGKDDE